MIHKLITEFQKIKFFHILKIYKNNLRYCRYGKNLELISKLPRMKIFKDNLFYSKVIGDDLIHILDSALYQKLLTKNHNKIKYYAMLSTEKSNRYHIVSLPRIWRKFFENNNLKINFFSFIFFINEIIPSFIQGMKTVLYLSFLYKQNFHKDSTVLNGSWNESFYQSNDLENYFNWLKKRYKSEFYYIFPGNKQINKNISYVRYAFPSISFHYKKVSFILSAFFYSILSFVLMIFGKWQLLYLLEDIVLYQYASRLEKGCLPSNIIFTIQNCVYKPLWTYALEKHSVHIVVVFYGTNDSFYFLKDGTQVGPSPEYTDTIWKNYHVVNNMQKIRLEETLSLNPFFKKNNISITVENNAIPFYDAHVDLSFLEETRNIVFFPVTPFSDPLVAKLGYTDMLYTYEITESILLELVSWGVKNKYSVILKNKNYPEEKINRRFVRLVNDLTRKKLITHILDADLSPNRLIAKCDAVICQPFTTPGVFAQSQNKPVCYADPSSLLLKKQPASSGIEIVQGEGALSKWLDDNLVI